MAWVRIDDSIFLHEKIVTAGNAAVGAWLRMLAWSANHLTDGAIPAKIAAVMSDGDMDAVEALVDCGLLEQTDRGYSIHDYLKYNPPASEVKEQREAVSEARRQAGLRSGESRRTKDEQSANKTGTKDEQTDEQNTNKIEPRTHARTHSPYDLRSRSLVDHERDRSTTSENGTRIPLDSFISQISKAGISFQLGHSERTRFSKLGEVHQFEIDHAIERAKQSGVKKPGYVLGVIEGERNRAIEAKEQPASQGPPLSKREQIMKRSVELFLGGSENGRDRQDEVFGESNAITALLPKCTT